MYDVGYIKHPSTEKRHRIWMLDLDDDNTYLTTAHTVEDCAKLVFVAVPQIKKVVIVLDDDDFPYSGPYSLVILLDNYKLTANQVISINRHIAQYYEVHFGSIDLAEYAVYDKIN